MATSARSGSPVKRAAAKEAAKQATSIREWKAANKPAPLTLPSGFTALVKVPGLAKLLAEGLISDTLTPIAEAAVQSGKGDKASQGMSDAQMREMAADPKKLSEAFDTFDKVLCFCVIEPHVEYYKYTEITTEIASDIGKVIPDDDRNEDSLYSDEVDLEDKMFIFNVVSGGTKDLEKFRKEFGETLDSVQSVPVNEGPSV